MYNFVSEFENRVFDNLLNYSNCLCDLNNSSRIFRIGVAVSGGADSISLLFALAHLSKKYSFKLYVISVDHKIRSSEESAGDVNFVRKKCADLNSAGYDIQFYEKSLENGEVFNLAEEKKCGVEDAARQLRYHAFSEFKNKFELDFICLAHNKNDNLETLLMRFLQGTPSSGIKGARGFYVRPLLSIERKEIEKYLLSLNVDYRTDKTNFDESYFRNRIRHSLFPLLDEKFPGWRESVLNGSKKVLRDENYFDDEISLIKPYEINDDVICFNKNELLKKKSAVLYRLVLNSISHFNVTQRFPGKVVGLFLDKLYSDSQSFEINSSSIVLGFDEKTVYVKKNKNIATDYQFFAIIENDGVFDFPFGAVHVCGKLNGIVLSIINEENIKTQVELKGLQFPFCIRSKEIGDVILDASGGKKSVADIFSDWHVKIEKKCNVPLIEDLKNQTIQAILGAPFGYKNWIVR